MSKAQLDLLRQVLGAGSAAANLPLDRVRRNFDKLFSRFPTLDDVDLREVELGGVRCDVLDARLDRDREAERLVVHLHGGGFVVGSPLSHRNLAARLSRASDAVVVLPDTRRAPEDPYPAQLEDALAVWGALRGPSSDFALTPSPSPDSGEGGQTSLRILSGDSAGAGLAILVASRLPDTERPDALVCLSPWADYAATTPSLDVYDPVDPLVDRAGLELMASYYLAGRDPWDPEITPLRADLSGLPPTLIQTGGEETLQDDAHRLGERLREHGVDVRLDVWEGMTHAWHLFAGRVDEAEQAIGVVGEWVRASYSPPWPRTSRSH